MNSRSPRGSEEHQITVVSTIHTIHGKDSFVQTRCIRNEYLHHGHRGIGKPGKVVTLETSRVKSRFTGKSGTGRHTTGTERKKVQGLSSLLFQGVSRIFCPEHRANRTGKQSDGTNGNPQKPEASNQALSDTARRLVHDTIFCRFPSSNKNQCHGTNQGYSKEFESKTREFHSNTTSDQTTPTYPARC